MSRPTPRELIRAHEELIRRARAVLAVIRNVLGKMPRDDVPRALTPLLSSGNSTLRSVHSTDESVELVMLGFTLTVPISLLSASDRDIATWTRSVVAGAADDSRRQKKLALQKKVSVATEMLARVQEDLARFQAELANLERDAA